MSKSKLGVLALISVLILSFSLSVLVAAQYTTEQTINVTIGSDGTFAATEDNVGVSFLITGAPGATGTVTVDVYIYNPQPIAAFPSGVSLTYFIAVTFDIPASDFSQATVTITYTASDVQNIQSPYNVYKYISSANSYVVLPSTVDPAAKTITVTLTSTTDALLAIGGTTKTTRVVPASSWIILAIGVIVIVTLAVFIISRLRPGHAESPENPENPEEQYTG